LREEENSFHLFVSKLTEVGPYLPGFRVEGRGGGGRIQMENLIISNSTNSNQFKKIIIGI